MRWTKHPQYATKIPIYCLGIESAPLFKKKIQ